MRQNTCSHQHSEKPSWGRWALKCTFQDNSRQDDIRMVRYMDFMKESLSQGDCEIWERRFDKVGLDWKGRVISRVVRVLILPHHPYSGQLRDTETAIFNLFHIMAHMNELLKCCGTPKNMFFVYLTTNRYNFDWFTINNSSNYVPFLLQGNFFKNQVPILVYKDSWYQELTDQIQPYYVMWPLRGNCISDLYVHGSFPLRAHDGLADVFFFNNLR